MSVELYIGGLGEGTVYERDLRQLLEPFGTVLHVLVKTTPEGRCRGFAFAKLDGFFEDAIKELDGSEFHGRTLRVSEANPRQSKSQQTTKTGNNHVDRNTSRN